MPGLESDYSSDKNITADITILTNRSAYNGSGLLAYIAGSGNISITLRSDEIDLDSGLKIQVGGDAETKEHIGGKKSSQDMLSARSLVVNNLTNYPLELDSLSSQCTGRSHGVVIDHGEANSIITALND